MTPVPVDKNGLIAGEDRATPASVDDLSWAVVKMRAGERFVINEALITAYQAASSPHSVRALKSDLEGFGRWCRRHNRVALPATPEAVADFLGGHAGTESKPASLVRYKASSARIRQLLELKDPTPIEFVKLRLQAIRRRLGTAQKQAGPLRFKGPVRNRYRRPAAQHSAQQGRSGRRGATAYLSPRTVQAVAAWLEAASITSCPVLRRVNVRRYEANAAVLGRPIGSLSGREFWDLRKRQQRSPRCPRKWSMMSGSRRCIPRRSARSIERWSSGHSIVVRWPI